MSIEKYICKIISTSLRGQWGNWHKHNKSGVKHRNTLGQLDQYMAQHGCIVKQSYCETVYVIIFFHSN